MPAKNAPIWASLSPAPRQYSWLDHDETCEVCVIGGGITGTMCALRLAQSGVDTVLITDMQLGYGITADTMPCVEFDGGHSLRRLSRKLGPELAAMMFELGVSAVSGLEELAQSFDGKCRFARRDCLLFTDDDNELEMFNKEFLIRRHAGFDCSYVSRNAAKDIFAFDIAGGIVSRGMAAEIAPYELTHLCAERAEELGSRVYENTKAVRMEYTNQHTVVHTSTHRTITSEKVVIASAGACADIIDGLSAPRTNFMAVSRPVTHFSGWPGRCVIRSWNSPRVTYATTPDGRICACGLDTSVVDEQSRLAGIFHMPALHEKRFKELDVIAKYFFPQIYTPGFEAIHAFRSYQTLDGMPIIGADDEHPGCIFAACCGTGGVLMSEIASRLVTEIYTGEESELVSVFSPARKALKR